MIFSNRYTMPLAVIFCISLLSSCTTDNETSLSSSSQYSVIHGEPVTYGGEVYETVVIGNQTWMAKNLNYNIPNNDTDICYNKDSVNCAKYGRLYNWYTAKTACPKGWHLPSDADWDELVNYVENENGCYGCAGIYLKATSGWNEDGNGEDKYGFFALPGGINSLDSSFRDIGDYGVWWSSNACYEYNAYGRIMYHAYDYAYYDVGDKETLLSVRCVKDIWNP